MNIAFPYRFDTCLRTAEADEDSHIRGLMEQLLLTTPGERANRPDFGSGVLQLVFAPTSPELAAAMQLMIQGALQQWLGELVAIQAVDVSSNDSTVTITVQYLNRRTRQRQTAQFARPLP